MLSHHSTHQIKETSLRIRKLLEQKGCKGLFLVTDRKVEPLITDFLPEVPRFVVEPGEESKTIASAERIWKFLIENGAIRRSVVVNVGGGMVSDLGGFAAATFKRGIGCINVPTTLLAAVDAAIGGKTGVNFAGLKNEIGVFALPLGVFPLTCLFSSLPENEWLSGTGEAIKTGLLDSPELFEMTISEDFIVKRDPDIVKEVVKRCEQFKTRIVTEDFKEGGKRKILNLGHTAGHALEEWKMAHGESLPHGIAVAHGLKFALEKSSREVGFPKGILEKYNKVLDKYFPPLDMTDSQLEEAWRFMAHDKKNVEPGKIFWILMKNIGQPV